MESGERFKRKSEQDESITPKDTPLSKVLLEDYYNNDLWNYQGPPETRFAKPNLKILACGIAVLLVMLTCVVLIFFFSFEEKVLNYDHNMVSIENPQDTNCELGQTCPTGCTPAVDEEIGCCIGCGLETDCNIRPLTVEWTDVPITESQQRIYLLVTTDCSFYYQTGFGPFLETTESGIAEINNACLSQPDKQIVIIACLSSMNLHDRTFNGFPVDYCNSTRGICVATNDVYQKGEL